MNLTYNYLGDDFKGARSLMQKEKPATEVPLQVTVPPHVKMELDLRSVETGKTRRALILEALKQFGMQVSQEDIAGRRGNK